MIQNRENDLSDIRAKAHAEHERLMRDDPQYRARYEHVCKIWDAVCEPLADGQPAKSEE